MPPSLALRPKDAAKALGIGERALWQFTKDGVIPCVKLGRCRLYPVALLQAFLAEQAKGGPINE
ncbi:MAG: helix-turn-helix domain-containing protein [Phycisphaeraceae bacterium]|nr:helix-turn-helix domain-containing protein [Phycisphaeraceae bacterium]